MKKSIKLGVCRDSDRIIPSGRPARAVPLANRTLSFSYRRLALYQAFLRQQEVGPLFNQRI